MALPLSQISLSPSSASAHPQNSPKIPHSNITFPIKSQPSFTKLINHPLIIARARKSHYSHPIITKATQESTGSNATSEAEAQNGPRSGEEIVPEGEASKDVEASQLGAEIKAAMKERAEKEQDLSLNGVAEEIREIEWPAFDKVLGTTWVVLGIIAGSSVVLLTVNAVLAEFSDRVFAGKGVQDFFN